MLRRSRISVRPNVSTRPSVSTAGRPATPAPPRDAPSKNQETRETQTEVNDVSVADTSAVVTSEKSMAAGDSHEKTGEGTSSLAGLQRRKRFSVKPKVAPGRIATSARILRSPVKAVSDSPVETAGSDRDKPTTSSQAGTPAPQGLRSPRRRRPSEETTQPKKQPEPTIPFSNVSSSSGVAAAEDSPEEPQLQANKNKKSESLSGSQAKEDPPKPPDKVPPSLPDKETVEISEKAETLVPSKSGTSPSPSKFSLSRLLNDPADLQRLAKARKLRELLRQEMHKEKKIKKAKARQKECTLDPAKMTMRDLIHYLPLSNPMTSLLEDSGQENETVVPSSPDREDSPERAQETARPDASETPSSLPGQREEDEEEADEEQEESLTVPQVKVAEDGSLIIDEESLTVEVQRSKGPNQVQDRDPIFERGSTTTYSSFRKGTYTKPWSNEETDMFFLAISMVGTDFSMVCQLFPHRGRSEIKNKFKKEERTNAWRIDKAFRERRKLDIEYFSKLLEKILEFQRNKRKLKSLTEKKASKKPTSKRKGKKAAKKLSDVEEEDEEEENESPDLEEEEGEKENEDLSNEGATAVPTPTRKCKRKNKMEASAEEPNNKRTDIGENDEQGDASIPEDAEAALPEDHRDLDMSEKTDSVNAVKPAQLSRGRAPKPLLLLGQKRGTKHPTPSTKPSDVREESAADEAPEKQAEKDGSPSRPAKEKLSSDGISSEGEESAAMPPRPSRYGRVPKPTQHLNYASKEDTRSSASETTAESASSAGSVTSAKCTAKRVRSSKAKPAPEPKKPKLVTLRASQSEYSDDEDERQREEEELEEEQDILSTSNKDSSAPVFVPVSLRSPEPVIAEVEEMMEELDILANVPDVLGMSQDALCSDASYEKEQEQDDTGTAGPCEHQLDLLVDVIDFLSSDNLEVSEDESYNEAAQTLLTIGNLAHLSQSAQNQTCSQDQTSGSTSVSETSRQEIKGEIPLKPAQEENSTTFSVTPAQAFTEASQSVVIVETEYCTTGQEPLLQTGDISVVKTSDETWKQQTVSEMESNPQLQSEISKKNSQQTRRGHLAKVKPKPNLGRTPRSTSSASQVDRCPDTRSQLVTEEKMSKLADSGSTSLTDEIPSTEIKLTEEPSERQQNLVDAQPGVQVKSGSATSDQSASDNQSHTFSEPQFLPNLEEDTKNTKSAEEEQKCHIRTTEDVCNNLDISDSAVAESQVGQNSNIIDSVPIQVGEHPPVLVLPVKESSTSHKEDSDVTSTCQTKKRQFSKVKPKPNLRRTSRTLHSKSQPTEDTVTHLETIKKPSSPTSNPEYSDNTETQSTCSTTFHEKLPESISPASVLTPSLELGFTDAPLIEETKTAIGLVDQVESSSENFEQNVPQKRRHFPKVKPKPNVGSSSSTAQSKLEPIQDTARTEWHHMDSSSHETPEQQPVTNNSAVTEPHVPENQFMLLDAIPQNLSGDKDAIDGESSGDTSSSQSKMEAGSASECRLEMYVSTKEPNTKPTERPSAVSEVQPSDGGFTGSKIKSVLTSDEHSELNRQQNTQQPCSEKSDFLHMGDSEVKTQDAVQHCHSETSETNKTDEDIFQATQSKQEPTDSSSSLRKAPQTRRARLPKPKPNLGRSGRPPQPRAAQNTTQAESEAVDDSGSHTMVPEISSDIQWPVEGATEQLNNYVSCPNDAESSLGCVVQTTENSTQDASMPTTGETQSYTNLTIFQDMLSEQVPSDPDEPFFILSLTEIPVCSSGELMGSGSEPFQYPSGSDAPTQQHSCVLATHGESLIAGGDEPLSKILLPLSVEESGKTGIISAKDVLSDQAASTSSVMEKLVDPHESMNSACPLGLGQPWLPKTVEKKEGTDVSLKNQRLTGRSAKLQVKPSTTKMKEAHKTLAAEEAESISTQANSDQESKLACHPVQPETFTAAAGDEVSAEPQKGSADHPDIEKATPMKGGEDTEDSSSGGQTQTSHRPLQSQVSSSLNRKPKGFLSFLSEKSSSASSGVPPPVKAASRSSKVKTPQTQRKQATLVPVASTSHDLASTPSTTPADPSTSTTTIPTQPEVGIQLTAEYTPQCTGTKADTSLHTAEVSAPQQSDCVESGSAGDEPTSVSQYFLSDIFTDVEEDDDTVA